MSGTLDDFSVDGGVTQDRHRGVLVSVFRGALLQWIALELESVLLCGRKATPETMSSNSEMKVEEKPQMEEGGPVSKGQS